jgi:hypothetical protein
MRPEYGCINPIKPGGWAAETCQHMYTIGTMIKAIVKFQYHTLIQIYVSLTNFFDDGTAIPRIDKVKYPDTIAHAQVTNVSTAERTFTIVYQPRFAFAHIVGHLTVSCNFIRKNKQFAHGTSVKDIASHALACSAMQSFQLLAEIVVTSF